MHPISYTYCGLNVVCWIHSVLIVSSADLEVTVALLVQIDKLVQLIESPVFTCEFIVVWVTLTV